MLVAVATVWIYPIFQDRDNDQHDFFQNRRAYYLRAVDAVAELRAKTYALGVDCQQHKEFPDSIPYFKYKFMRDRGVALEHFIGGVDPAINFYGRSVQEAMTNLVIWHTQNSKDCAGQAFKEGRLQDEANKFIHALARPRQYQDSENPVSLKTEK